MIYGKELIEKLRKELNVNTEANNRRLEQGLELSETFVSNAVNSLMDRLINAKLYILSNKGLGNVEALYDLEGNRVDAKMVRGRFGMVWLFSDKAQQKYGIKFLSADLQEKTYARKGFVVKMEQVPVWATLKSSGKGISGIATTQVVVFPSNVNYYTGEKVVK